ncbi:hypothetical protein GGR51DRAFT_142361 [Nemania sp. FL0031]|nr:hypothetical protein GGR51DRAFT_142361 [Nemania sp. FL0031]
MSFPPFSSLPLDQVVTEAAKEIQSGIRVSLDWPLTTPKYPSYGRPQVQHEVVNRAKGSSLRVVNDDFLSFNTQSSSQWDGFRHFGNLHHKRYYNNRTHGELMTSGVLGIHTWAEHGGIVGRGVLLDYASWAEERCIELKPFESVQVPLSHIKDVAKAQNTTFRPGDILIIRFGFTAVYNILTDDEQRALAQRPVASFSGIESSEATLRFLWDNQFAAVAGDCPSFECSPPVGPQSDSRFILHEWLLGGWGMPVGEMFDLEKLSETCKQLQRHTFFFSSQPLKVPGGVASPPNAIAIF